MSIYEKLANLILNFTACTFLVSLIFLWLRRRQGGRARYFLIFTCLYGTLSFFVPITLSYTAAPMPVSVLCAYNLIGGLFYLILLHLYPIEVISPGWLTPPKNRYAIHALGFVGGCLDCPSDDNSRVALFRRNHSIYRRAQCLVPGIDTPYNTALQYHDICSSPQLDEKQRQQSLDLFLFYRYHLHRYSLQHIYAHRAYHCPSCTSDSLPYILYSHRLPGTVYPHPGSGRKSAKSGGNHP